VFKLKRDCAFILLVGLTAHGEISTRPSAALKVLARDPDSSLIEQLSAPESGGARRTIGIRRSDGELVMLDNIEGATLLDGFIRARLVYEAVPLDAEQRREYLLTPAGQARLGVVR
jgi:hypothetical protein